MDQVISGKAFESENSLQKVESSSLLRKEVQKQLEQAESEESKNLRLKTPGLERERTTSNKRNEEGDEGETKSSLAQSRGRIDSGLGLP